MKIFGWFRAKNDGANSQTPSAPMEEVVEVQTDGQETPSISSEPLQSHEGQTVDEVEAASADSDLSVENQHVDEREESDQLSNGTPEASDAATPVAQENVQVESAGRDVAAASAPLDSLESVSPESYPPESVTEAPEREREFLAARKSRRLTRHQERRLARDKTEPCDAADLFLQSSESRLREATMALAESRVGLRVAERMVQRVIDRYEEDLQEQEHVNAILGDLAQWVERQRSVAWEFAERAHSEVQSAEADLVAAQDELSKLAAYQNPNAAATYRKFAASVVGIPLIFLYLYSVVLLTLNRFDWLLHYIPPFNLGRLGLLLLLAGPCCWWLLAAGWKYTSAVRLAQKTYIEKCEHAERNYQQAVNARRELHRLSAQFELIEPFMRVLAHGYRSAWTSGGVAQVAISTDVDQAVLPASFGLARAVKGDESATSELENAALREVVRPGWRTDDMAEIGQLYAEREGLQANALSLSALDSDLGEYATSAGARLISAFADYEIQRKLGGLRLRHLVRTLHSTILRGASGGTRPPVMRQRLNGYESLDLSSTWLHDENPGEDWIEYLSAIFTETPPMRTLGIANPYGPLGRGTLSSTYLVPDYLADIVDTPPGVRREAFAQGLSPVDIAVRVDNSEWAPPGDFTIFSPKLDGSSSVPLQTETDSVAVPAAPSFEQADQGESYA